MYGGGMVAQMDAEKRSEQALLGERLPDATDKPDEVCRSRMSLFERNSSHMNGLIMDEFFGSSGW